MRKFKLASRALAEGGEYVLGLKDTGTHTCYMIYGRLAPGEGGRSINPGAAHEEIVLAVRGRFEVAGGLEGTIEEGEAFHVSGDLTCYLRNLTDKEAVYVAAGGHSEGGHGH